MNLGAHRLSVPTANSSRRIRGCGDQMDDPRHVNGQDARGVRRRTSRSDHAGIAFSRRRGDPAQPASTKTEMFGRDGILAHTYMLGPNGQSNGCVSFKNYAAFLRAFQTGDIDRLVVVAELGDTMPDLDTAPAACEPPARRRQPAAGASQTPACRSEAARH